jgi:hypothetical protein
MTMEDGTEMGLDAKTIWTAGGGLEGEWRELEQQPELRR